MHSPLVPDSSRIQGPEPQTKSRFREQRIKIPIKRESVGIITGQSSRSSIHYLGDDKSAIEKSRDRSRTGKYDSTRDPSPIYEYHHTIQAEGHIKCECTVCKKMNKAKPEPEKVPRDSFFEDFDFRMDNKGPYSQNDFVFILKLLMPPKHMSHSMSVNIPETLALIDGETKFIVLTGKDKSLKYIQQRERLVHHEIKKFFHDQFTKKDEEIKRVESIIMTSCIFTPAEESPANSDRRHLGMIRRGESPSEPTGNFPIRRNSTLRKNIRHVRMKNHALREVALVKFIDDSVTVLCDIEFENLISRKKFDPFWKKVSYIQNYRGFTSNIHTMKRVYFVYERDKENSLFERAAVEAHQLNGEVPPSSDRYIPPYEEEEFETRLKLKNEDQYCLYILMKIFHFLELIRGVRILKMGADFVKDSFEVVWLMNITRMQFQPLVKEVHENHLRGMSIMGLDLNDKLSTKESEALYDPKRREEIDSIADNLKKQYLKLRESAGITINKPNYQEDLSDNAFAELYPNVPFRLSSLLKKEVSHKEFKLALEGNPFKLTRSGRVKPITQRETGDSSIDGMKRLKKMFPDLFSREDDNTLSTRDQTLVKKPFRAKLKLRGQGTPNSIRHLLSDKTLSPINPEAGGENLNRSLILRKSEFTPDRMRSQSQSPFRTISQYSSGDSFAKTFPHPPSESFGIYSSNISKRTRSGTSSPFMQTSCRRIFSDKMSQGEKMNPYIEPFQLGSRAQTPYMTELKGLTQDYKSTLAIEQIGSRTPPIDRESLISILSGKAGVNY